MKNQIAIDGPAGAGKSTVAKAVAAKLGFIYVDTGAMYRSMALHFIRENVDLEEEEAVKAACDCADITISHVDGVQQVFLNGENVSGLIRTEEVGNKASAVATIPMVRLKMVDLQRKLAEVQDVVMDGRDIGSYVLPQAPCKIYLTASSAERARRRCAEYAAKGIEADFAQVEKDIIERDERDKNREFAPLCVAEDAIFLDSSDMGIEEVVSTILGYFEDCQ